MGLSFALLSLVWVALDGTGSLLVGTLFSALAAAMGVWLAPLGSSRLAWRRLPRFAVYFLAESFRGGTDVAWRAFHPSLPLEPKLGPHQVRLPPGAQRTLFVGTVSLLPGTLSVDLRDSDDLLVVHSLAGEPGEALDALQSQIARLFAAPSASGG